MAEWLYEEGIGEARTPVRIYAPVGSHKDLLAYLVRRLLENGANSSFVNHIADEQVSLDDLVKEPVAELSHHANARIFVKPYVSVGELKVVAHRKPKLAGGGFGFAGAYLCRAARARLAARHV